jgi:hypothetical protein
VWNMWHELQNANLDASTYPPGSEIRQLLTADETTIGKVAHDLAEKHGFYLQGSESVQINLSDKMTLGSQGEILLNGEPMAPSNPDLTPPYPQPEPAPESEPVTTSATEEIPMGPSPEQAEMYSGAVDYEDTDSAISSDVEPSASEAPQMFTKDHTLINPAMPAIYQAQDSLGGKYLVAYGGTEEARRKFVDDFIALAENKDKVVRFERTVPSVRGPQTSIIELGKPGPLQYALNFFRGTPPPISPDTFVTKVSK